MAGTNKAKKGSKKKTSVKAADAKANQENRRQVGFFRSYSSKFAQVLKG